MGSPEGNIWEFFLPQDFALAFFQMSATQRPIPVAQRLEADWGAGSGTGIMQPGVPTEGIPCPSGCPWPWPCPLSDPRLKVTGGYGPPWKGWGRGAPGMWSHGHKKDISTTWVVQFGKFPDRTS